LDVLGPGKEAPVPISIVALFLSVNSKSKELWQKWAEIQNLDT
jgi:hypothetical protein